jgi:hypothetical protein
MQILHSSFSLIRSQPDYEGWKVEQIEAGPGGNPFARVGEEGRVVSFTPSTRQSWEVLVERDHPMPIVAKTPARAMLVRIATRHRADSTTG